MSVRGDAAPRGMTAQGPVHRLGTEFGLQVLLPKKRQSRLGDPQPGLAILRASLSGGVGKSCQLFRDLEVWVIHGDVNLVEQLIEVGRAKEKDEVLCRRTD
jgi:hypothetical protein